MISYLSHSLGDILASAMRNTQNLLQMPYGCGEQNMVLFTPNIYVLNYLNETQQLTPEVKSKAIGFLNTGEWLNEWVKTSQYYFNNTLGFPIGLSYLSILWYIRLSCYDSSYDKNTMKLNFMVTIQGPNSNKMFWTENLLTYDSKFLKISQGQSILIILWLQHVQSFILFHKPSTPGYQRQLNYKHSDGSYSTFGETYGSSTGNTW